MDYVIKEEKSKDCSLNKRGVRIVRKFYNRKVLGFKLVALLKAN